MSWVLLTDAFAYKLKEPVRYDYLDFSTPAARRADGALTPCGQGQPVDWLVKMQRLPAARIARVAERRFIPSAARLWVRRYPSEEWPCVDVVW